MRNELVFLDEASTAIARVETIGEAKDIADKASAIKLIAAKQNWSADQKIRIGEIEVRATARLGELLEEKPPAKTGPKQLGSSGEPNHIPTLADLGVTKKQSHVAQKLAAVPAEVREKAIAEARDKGKQPTVAGTIREGARKKVVKDLKEIVEKEAEEPTGQYDVIVIDPPWQMHKIERECRPNQVGLDYPTMSEEDLGEPFFEKDLYPRLALKCHVFLWTTQRHLPTAFRLLSAWGLRYVLTFVWHKPGGVQPVDLPQYNCEFALYARYGSPSFIDTKAFPTCFEAPRGKHSEKPSEFYETLCRVTGGRRLDMFNRRDIEGFDGWGKEAPDDSVDT